MHFEDYIPHLLPAQWCQAFFILAAVLVVSVTVLPSAPSRLMLNYGARGSATGGKDTDRLDWSGKIVSSVTSRSQIPHKWFATFYMTSLACSAFWAYQYAEDGRLLRSIVSRQAAAHRTPAYDRVQDLQGVVATWALMALQAVRRLYEQLFVAKQSTSTMWVVHWLLGTAFYAAMSVAVWVEGSDSILDHRQRISAVNTAVSASRILGVVLFLLASVAQHWCHKSLAGLKKYSLPSEGLFRYVVCPHYTCECVLYLALAMVAAPNGQLLNRTILSASAFVAANLGVTAYGTRRWYEEKFGAEKLAGRSTMVPLVY